MCSCPPTSSEPGHTNGVLFHAQSSLCSSTPLEDGLFVGYCTGVPPFLTSCFRLPYQYHIKLPLKTHVSTICQRRGGLACSETTKRHKVSATSETIPLGISHGVVKWELWNFTACIRVGGSSQSIVSPGLQIPARPQPPFHLRNVLLDNTEVMPVQWELHLQGPAP